MLAQVIVQHTYASEVGRRRSSSLPGFKMLLFGVIVCVVKVEGGCAQVLHEETIYSVPFSSLKEISGEKEILSWADVERIEQEKKQKIIRDIENLFAD